MVNLLSVLCYELVICLVPEGFLLWLIQQMEWNLGRYALTVNVGQKADVVQAVHWLMCRCRQWCCVYLRAVECSWPHNSIVAILL